MSNSASALTECRECASRGFVRFWVILLFKSYKPQLVVATCPRCGGSGIDKGKTLTLLSIGLEPENYDPQSVASIP